MRELPEKNQIRKEEGSRYTQGLIGSYHGTAPDSAIGTKESKVRNDQSETI